MTDDLIERLRAFVVERGKVACGSDIVSACNNSALSLSDLRALLDALEAAREDAERYRWLRSQNNEDFSFSVVKNPHFDVYDSAEELDAAIDAAREARNG